MTENETLLRSCPRCRSSIPSNAAGALCPACLMSQALEATDEETLSWGSHREPVERSSESWPTTLGDYRLIRVLGSGGMGRVYEAEQLETGRRVALKRLGRRLDSPEMRQRFLREGRLAASVSHPHSLYIFGSEDIDGIPVITMEIAESGTLEDELTKRGPLPVKEAVDAILDVISGLEAAQAVGVLHRDVKPSNCFVTPAGSVKIGDYGLSISSLTRDDSYATTSGQIMGTPAYASPEQLRGDELDLRADLYSVGATLFALLTGRAPFEGQNAVQVVANAVNMAPKKISELREGLPPDLDRVVARCLAKEPGGRYGSYESLRTALLPFSSLEKQPVPMKLRSGAGWIDFLLAFFVPYVVLVMLVGSATFHYGWLMERTLFAARYYFVFLALGVLYFTLTEGLSGAGFGKRQKGLRVVGPGGRRPGLVRASIRILSPILVIEAVRLPLVFATVTARSFEELTMGQNLSYTVLTTLCPWAAALLTLTARPSNGFATPWDMLSGTRVVFEPARTTRPKFEPVSPPTTALARPETFGPYCLEGEVISGCWLLARDPVLRRPVWLIKREALGPSTSRRGVSRPGRARWLQKVDARGGVWDAYEASPGVPFRSVIATSGHTPWLDLRHWLHDLASELWAADADETLPARLSLDHVWLTATGHGLLLDLPWPVGDEAAESICVDDIAGQQRFLHEIADCVEKTSLPLHAQPVSQNLALGRFEKLSFLAGTLRGLLDRRATLRRRVRAGALFMLPTYCLLMVFLGSLEGMQELDSMLAGPFGSFIFFAILLILVCAAVVQLLLVPFRTTTSHAIFRLAVVDARGRLASRQRLLARWAVAWLPLTIALLATARVQGDLAGAWPFVWLAVWLVAVIHAAFDPHQGLHDRLAGTWVVCR